jgi:hypothetical protein
MRYLKYFEGFTNDELNNLINSEKTSVFKINRNIENKNNLLSDDLINYDISGFTYEESNDHYIIQPDDKFIELYNRYCLMNKLSPKKLIFLISILPNPPISVFGYNQIDSENILPDSNLKGLSIVYKLYKYILNIKDIGFIMTNKDNLPEAKNLWYNLLQDKDVYSGTNQYYNIIIKKDIDDTKLKSILDKVEKFDLIYDIDLNSKIKELYG